MADLICDGNGQVAVQDMIDHINSAVDKTGDTMSGTLVTPEIDTQVLLINGEPLEQAIANHNLIINGSFQVNQRSFDGLWDLIADGSYGYDRWKKSGSDIQQVIEEGFFEPNTVYTLSGTNVNEQQISSPGTGNWTITVPNDATDIVLTKGDSATTFVNRLYPQELSLCQRYYIRTSYSFKAYAPSGVKVHSNATFPTTMRDIPVITAIPSSTSNVTELSVSAGSNYFMYISGETVDGRYNMQAVFDVIEIDAEI